MPKINLFSTHFQCGNKERQKELDFCHEKNQANPLIDPMDLTVGQVIRLPSAEQVTLNVATSNDRATAGDPSAATSSGGPVNPVGGFVIYQVKSGDSLFTIAKQFYQVPQLWRVIHEANRDVIGPDPNRLRAGMKLRIPPAPIPASR